MNISVHSLNHTDLPLIKQYFLRLDARDRCAPAGKDLCLRSGLPLTLEQMHAYLNSIDFQHGSVFGVFDEDRQLAGVAHLVCWPQAAEVGVSVLEAHRNRGIGTALLKRVILRARNLKIIELFVHCAADNAVMRHLARKIGMHVVLDDEGADAYMELPPGDVQSFGAELTEEGFTLLHRALMA